MQKALQILLVEDDPDDVELLETALHNYPVSFQSAVIHQGDQVIRHLLLGKKFPDVIILDLNLPKMHGKEILARIKDTDSIKQIPVIVMTTSSAAADRQYCLDLGAADYIIKPVTIEEFKSVVETILSVAGASIS